MTKFFCRLKMEIKEEAVERPEPYPDDDDPLSWNVKLVNKTLHLRNGNNLYYFHSCYSKYNIPIYNKL